MPLVYSKVDLHEVKVLLRRKGYGMHRGGGKGIALQLNTPSTERFRQIDGEPLREVLRGITATELDQILKLSEDAHEAALHVERLSLGDDLAPLESLMAREGGGGGGLSMEQVGHLVDNRVQAALQPAMQQMQGMMDQLKGLLSGKPIEAPKEPDPAPPPAKPKVTVTRPAKKKTAKAAAKKTAKKAPAKKKAAKAAKKGGGKKPPKPSAKDVEKTLDEMGLGGARGHDYGEDGDAGVV